MKKVNGNWRLTTGWQTTAGQATRTATGKYSNLSQPSNVSVFLAQLCFPHERSAETTLEYPPISYEGQQEFDHYSSSAREGEESFILKFHCPSLSSLRWMVKLYSLVLGGLGVILSFTWICFHLYVLSVTSLPELRQQR